MENNLPLTQVNDLGLAAALISCNFPLEGTPEGIDRRLVFLFDSTDQLERTIKAYWANTLDVKARTYFDNTKMLKSVIYAERGSL